MTVVRTKNAQRRFSAERNEQGVPRVKASNWLDALYGLGYMHAVDRGTQMLFARAVAAGRSAERIADQPELRETDRFFRRTGLYLHLEREVHGMDDNTFSQVTAYCEGVNDGLKGSGRSLPMWATGFHPQPWNQMSVLLIGNLLSFGGLAVSQMENERLLLELIHSSLRDEALRELFAPRLDNADFDLLRQVKMANKLSDDALELITDLPRLAGSNAWAVSGARTATGAPILCGDPHLEINRLPAIWYEAILQWDDQYVMGATLPGCPLFAVARTPRLAWSVTYMKGDTIDYFVEDCRRNEQGAWQYRRDADWLDFQVREELIEGKGAEPDKLLVYSNDLGTIDSDLSKAEPGYHLSVAWTGQDPGYWKAISTWLDMVHCRDASAGLDVARDCPQPTLCWVVADRSGHIGMQGCGRFPQRGKGVSGLYPVPAWDAKYHWQGLLPKEVLPRIYDPPEGFVATANEDINPYSGTTLITQPLPGYRARRIRQRLAELPQATLQDMKDLQYDLYSHQAEDLLAIFLPHLPPSDLRTRLENWDRCYRPTSHEATLFQRLYVNVMVEVFGNEQAIGWRRTLYLVSRMGYSVMVLTAADGVLAQDDSTWWRDRDKGELIRRAAERLTPADDQPWSNVNYFHFTDRFFGSHQVGHILGFNSPRHPMPGCHATVFQGHVLQTAKRESTFAPSYHFITDLGTHHAHSNLPGGPSESRFSRYYKSDVPLWFDAEYKRLEGEA